MVLVVLGRHTMGRATYMVQILLVAMEHHCHHLPTMGIATTMEIVTLGQHIMGIATLMDQQLLTTIMEVAVLTQLTPMGISTLVQHMDYPHTFHHHHLVPLHMEMDIIFLIIRMKL